MHTTNLSDRQAARLLDDATPEGLLQTFAALTHRLHAATETARANDNASWATQTERDLRVQRDQVETELLRRMGA